MICAARCHTRVIWRDGELVDEATGYPHRLTCPKSHATSGRRTSSVQSYCIVCASSQLHQTVKDRRTWLKVCLQCGHGEVFPATRPTPSGRPATSRR